MDIKIVNNSFLEIRTIRVHAVAPDSCIAHETQARQAFSAYLMWLTVYTLPAILLTKMVHAARQIRLAVVKNCDR